MLTYQEIRSMLIASGSRSRIGSVYITTANGNIPIMGVRSFGSGGHNSGLLMIPTSGSNFILSSNDTIGSFN